MDRCALMVSSAYDQLYECRTTHDCSTATYICDPNYSAYPYHLERALTPPHTSAATHQLPHYASFLINPPLPPRQIFENHLIRAITASASKSRLALNFKSSQYVLAISTMSYTSGRTSYRHCSIRSTTDHPQPRRSTPILKADRPPLYISRLSHRSRAITTTRSTSWTIHPDAYPSAKRKEPEASQT